MPNEAVESPSYRVIAEQPDLNTIEVATYGSKYKLTKSALYVLDMMIDEAEKRYISAVASCYGDEARAVLDIYRTRPNTLRQDRPASRDLEDLMNLQKSNSIYRRASTLKTLKQMRVEVELHGALCGLQEYGDRMMTDGIDPDLIRMVVRERASSGMLNDYESVQGILNGSLMSDSERERRMAEMSKMILETNEYVRMENEYPEATEEEWARQNAWMHGVEDVHGPESVPDVPSGDSDEIGSSHMDRSVLSTPWIHVSGMDESEVMGTDEPEPIDSSDVGRPADAEMIQPASSSAKDAIGTIPRPEDVEETARIQPDGSDPAEAVASVPKREEKVRIGPASNGPRDALKLMDAIALERPLCEDGSYARWFKGLNARQYSGKTYLQDDGGIILIQEIDGHE